MSEAVEELQKEFEWEARATLGFSFRKFISARVVLRYGRLSSRPRGRSMDF